MPIYMHKNNSVMWPHFHQRQMTIEDNIRIRSDRIKLEVMQDKIWKMFRMVDIQSFKIYIKVWLFFFIESNWLILTASQPIKSYFKPSGIWYQ